ncbi:MAG: hypothetical protein HRF46_01345 [Acidobacteriota bacterium]|jgi:hypothetical protein
MRALAFEARRLSREAGFVVLASVLHLASLLQSILDGSEPAGTVLFAPLLAAWVAAGDTAANARGGRLDFVVTRGPSLAGLQLARFLLGWGCGTTLLAASTLTLVGRGQYLAYSLEYLGVVGYWAAVGALLGQRVSAAATLLLAVTTSVLALWWHSTGAILLLRQLPGEWPAVLITGVLQFLGCVIPSSELSWLRSLPRSLAWLPWLLAPALLGLALRAARRRQLPAQEEG